MYSVNGQCVAQSTTEEIKTILTNRYNLATIFWLYGFLLARAICWYKIWFDVLLVKMY